MSSSTLTNYSSGDTSAPVLTGAVGSLLTLLDAVLVNGYGSKTAAGWTKPIATSGNCAGYKQGAGCGFVVHINDNGPGAGTYKEARMTGWETLSAVGTVGTGTGQFPLPAQQLTTGFGVIRKSATADSTARAWQVFADASTFYLFIQSGDVSGNYSLYQFGDFFSLAGSGDLWRCILIARIVENSATQNTSTDQGDYIGCLVAYPTLLLNGHFIPRTYGGTGTSIAADKIADVSKMVSSFAITEPMAGAMTFPNPADGSMYLSPVWVRDLNPVGSLRGYMRGCYMLCHAASNFSDGQTFSGANDFAGKSLKIVKPGPSGGMWCMETSATTPTN